MDEVITDMAGEEKMIRDAFERLLESYSRSNHRQKFEIINKAFVFANQAHKGVKRRSGEPYIMHPLAVALIVSDEMGLGSTSICSALLHDVVEDTDYTVEDIRNLFGDKIAQIVGGLTKISGGIFAEAASAQAENMRKLLLTMSDDIRVILIKIADRLHNMRTLGALLPAKQYKIAGETMYLYAPMAHRLGLFAIKSELEDLSFKYEHPDEYRQISQKLEATANNREKIYDHFTTPLHPKLDELGIRYKMQKRVKSIYSIWNKMHVKRVDFEDIYDIFAVRIVFEPKPDIDVKKQCWDIYSAVTDLYKLRPDRIRDWVSRPKANGYQALHLTVMGPDGQWIEIQIRSAKMDEIAEKGFAAHWKYKEHGNSPQLEKETELDRWLERIQDILEAPSPNAMDFLDTIKMNLYASEIFVFTPKGEIKTLPQGATALDFGYEIHTNVGDHCIGAKVNHRLVPLSHKLNSGDQVEILTSRSQSPYPEWLNFVTTAKAKTKIESSLKKRKKEKVREGEQILDEIFRKAGMEITIQVIDKLLSSYGYPKKEDLYFSLAEKQVDLLPENLKKILKEKSGNYLMKFVKHAFNVGSGSKENAENKPAPVLLTDASEIDRKKTYILEEEGFQKNYIAAPCCNPIPGDDVLGFVRTDNHLEVHKRSCSVALTLKTRFGDRIISCEWAGHKVFSFPCSIEVKGIDRIGILSEITQVIANDLSVNVRKLSLASGDGFFGGTIEVTIHDVDDINTLINCLQKIKGVKSVKRTD
ncbi:MAG: RelA/SpoT family protein [Dysgonamonadaceae bacterium]|jgi:GTP pyrophosphokinase|nr:RelA/SpoT family protein [Dysgonamonadaceae bacterium]